MKIFAYYFLPLISIAVFIGSSSPIIRHSFGNNDPAKVNAKWKTGVALYSFNRFSFADALEKADSAEVRYVEGFSFHALGKEFNDKTMATASKEDIGKMKEMMDEKGMKMPSMYVGGAKDENEWKFYFDIAKALEMQFLVCEPQKDQWDMLDSLGGLYKIKIAIHEHAKGSSQYWHPDSVLVAIKNHPNIGACADLGHWARSGLDPVQCLQQLEGHILGIHLKDIDEANVKANDVVLGTGIINYPEVIRELKHQNFKGMMYVECEHKMENNLSDVVQALRYLDDLAKK